MRGLRPEPRQRQAAWRRKARPARARWRISSKKLTKPRAAWVMVPAGDATESTVLKLAGLMEPGDTIIDGGNSYYKDDIRRAKILKESGIHYLDVGTSGGVWGIERGYCMMIGGSKESVGPSGSDFQNARAGHGRHRPHSGTRRQEAARPSKAICIAAHPARATS